MDEQGLQQGVHAGVTEAQPGDAGADVGDDRRGQVGERSGAADRVVAEALDAQQAPVGGGADLPQGGQGGQPFREPEVAGVVDRGLGPQRSPLLVVLLDGWPAGIAPAGSPRTRREPLSSPGSYHPVRATAARCTTSHRQCARSPGRACLISASVLYARRGARRRCLYLRRAHRTRYRSM